MSSDMISFPRELSDELAELITEKARVCGGGAFEIWEAICEQFGTVTQPNTCTKDGGQCWPVAWLVETDLGKSAYCNDPTHWAHGYKVSPLYRHPPAQAPVVLPERKSSVEVFTTYGLGECSGWNAYDDEFKRLNPSIEP